MDTTDSTTENADTADSTADATEARADAPSDSTTGVPEESTAGVTAESTTGVPERLETLRADPTRRRALAVAGAVVGLAVAQVHWLGFLLGGALVGLVAPTLRRALLYGLAFGLVGVALFAVVLLQAGVLGGYAATGQLFYVGLAVPVAFGLVGSLVRGVV